MLIDVDSEGLMIEKVPIGAVFVHYKGLKYEILCIGRHTEREHLHVVYKALYTDSEFGEGAIWIRPLSMFLERVEVDGELIPRFQRILYDL
jgi:hypothetical protein